MKRMIVANWKMNLDPHETELYMHKLNKLEVPANVEVVICPPFIDLQMAARTIDAKKFKIGAQNAYHVDAGTFTGEVSAAMLRNLVNYVIIGHSERRNRFFENDKLIAEKLAAVIRNGMTPILCIGENLDQRHSGLSKKVVIDQLEADLSHLTAEDMHHLVIAYEPIWALSDGHGNSTHAKPEDVAFIFDAIRSTIESLYGEDVGPKIKLLYGGSADPQHSKVYLEINGVDGLLVGGASLIAPKFGDIIKSAN